MKKYFKLLTTFIISFALITGIKANAWDYDQKTIIDIPIHKTDKEGTALEGAKFTLKDINGKSWFESTEKKDGDYLIESSDEISFEDAVSMLPEEYQIIVDEIKDNDSSRYDYTGDFYVREEYIDFVFPMYIEETVPPTGYQSKTIVVPAIVTLYIHQPKKVEIRDEAYLRVYTYPGAYQIGYFEYDENTDYIKIFNKLNYYWSSDNYNQSKYYSYLEENGMIVDKVVCDSDEPIETPPPANNYIKGTASREDLEMKLADESIAGLCILQLEDEKETKKEVPIVNPETAGTIAILVILATIGTTTLLATRKFKKN